ncbi:MAG: flagellar basal body-associated protein FliL [Lachnospiraceae bacterium]|nr:flagellar basal body-associated protein FliL [Lachnospiraceae bacterium]
MKKNLISIIVLALLIINIVLTAIMMFSVISTNKKTAALVTDIASAISLDLRAGEGEVKEAVSMEDTVTYTIADMTIPLKKSEATDSEGNVKDTKDHFALASVTFSMNSKHKDYKNYGEDMASREELIKGKIFEAFNQLTMEEAQADSEAIRQDILKKIQDLFGSDFIFDATIRVIYQ